MGFRGERLKAIRIARNKTMGQLARETGVPIGTIASMENGYIKNPSSKQVEPLAKKLGISESYFYIEDARLPSEIIDLPADVRELIESGDIEDMGYIVLGAKAKKNGIPLEVLNRMIDDFKTSAEKMKKNKHKDTEQEVHPRKSEFIGNGT